MAIHVRNQAFEEGFLGVECLTIRVDGLAATELQQQL